MSKNSASARATPVKRTPAPGGRSIMAVLEKEPETKPVQGPASPVKAGAVPPAAPTFEEDDPICVVLRGWGTPALPLDRTSYLDGYAFTGGVARNIPYSEAKAWAKRGLVD